MEKLLIGEADAGQRLDKYLKRYLNRAPGSFVYKMLRKKNITLNGKKATGGELIATGDELVCFLSEETIAKFRGLAPEADPAAVDGRIVQARAACRRLGAPDIYYEDDHVLVVNKPVGLLVQKADSSDVSLTEWIPGYLLKEGRVTQTFLASFWPSPCHRLDRNTGGLVICGKTPAGARIMSGLIRDRSLKKYYFCPIWGRLGMEAGACLKIEGYLKKNEKNNQVTISETPGQGDRIETVIRELELEEVWRLKKENRVFGPQIEAMEGRIRQGLISCLEVELITGKSHQIRAHLASIGHPLVGDMKYTGNRVLKRENEGLGRKQQVLYAWKLVFPKLEGAAKGLSERVIEL